MVRLSRPGLTLSRSTWPVWGGGGAAVLAAAFFVVLPDWRLESLVDATGLGTVLPLAQPPLGNTARLLLALAAAVVAGAVAWSVLFLLVGPGGVLQRKETSDVPSVRRADAHPDAPPRRPMTAAELGVPPPPPEPPVEQPIPADLDQPMATFDPRAIPDVPREPVRPVAPIAVVAAPESRPAPRAVAPAPAPLPRGEAPSASIAALLDRLEKGARRRR